MNVSLCVSMVMGAFRQDAPMWKLKRGGLGVVVSHAEIKQYEVKKEVCVFSFLCCPPFMHFLIFPFSLLTSRCVSSSHTSCTASVFSSPFITLSTAVWITHTCMQACEHAYTQSMNHSETLNLSIILCNHDY